MQIPPRMGHALYRISQQLQGSAATTQHLRYLEESQRLTVTELQELQFRKLCRIISHAYETVPYYHRLLLKHNLRPDDIKDFDDFRRLPVLSRADLLKNRNTLISSKAGKSGMWVRSSGSTGEQVACLQDKEFRSWTDAHQLRTYKWTGWRLGDPFALVWGSPVYFEKQTRGHRINNALTNRIEINAYLLDAESIKNILEKIRLQDPVIISGYTTALYLLAKEALAQNLVFPRLRAVQPNAEPLPPTMRAEISRAFQCEVFDKYGSRETNIVAHESPNHEGLCIQSENVYLEFLREDGSFCEPGQAGQLVITTLNNLSMPLLRYQTTDLAAPIADYCSSGLPFPRMTPVFGRMQDLIQTPAGGVIHPQFFSNLMRQFGDISWFQIVQQKEGELLCRIHAPTGLSQETQERIIDQVAIHAGFRFDVTFEPLSDMPHSKTGKFRLCINELSIDNPLHKVRSMPIPELGAR